MHVGWLRIPTREGVGEFIIFRFGGGFTDIFGVLPFLDVGLIEEGIVIVHKLDVIGCSIRLGR